MQSFDLFVLTSFGFSFVFRTDPPQKHPHSTSIRVKSRCLYAGHASWLALLAGMLVVQRRYAMEVEGEEAKSEM